MKQTLFALFLVATTFGSFGQVINATESVEYDASQNRFLISNGSSIIARASDGTLSFFSSEGASAGMEVMGNHLFVISGSSIRGFELDTANQVMSINIPGAGFLNGLTNDGNNTLFVTDFSNNRIHRVDVSNLSNPSQEIIVPNTGNTPNGIIYDGANNQLIFVTFDGSGNVKAVNLSDNSVSTIISTSLESIDGIDEDNDKNYDLSSWPAQITKYDSTFTSAETITTPFITNPADICYAKETDTLAIPSGGTEIVYVGLGVDRMTTSMLNVELDDLKMNVFPNPISAKSMIQFELEQSETLNLSIWNQQGQRIKTLLDGRQAAGPHHIAFVGIDMPSGMYFLTLKMKEGRKSIPIYISH